MKKTALLSPDKRYRYNLTRIWDENKYQVCFVGLNPSTADAKIDDPTIRRCMAFARLWEYGGIIIVNLFAFRSTDPNVLHKIDDPVGPENDYHISMASRALTTVFTVCCWGGNPVALERIEKAARLIRDPRGLGFTKNGQPRHPLYLKANAWPNSMEIKK